MIPWLPVTAERTTVTKQRLSLKSLPNFARGHRGWVVGLLGCWVVGGSGVRGFRGV